MDDLIKEFLVESTENLDRLDSELVKLESDPSSKNYSRVFLERSIRSRGAADFWASATLKKSHMRARAFSPDFETENFLCTGTHQRASVHGGRHTHHAGCHSSNGARWQGGLPGTDRNSQAPATDRAGIGREGCVAPPQPVPVKKRQSRKWKSGKAQFKGEGPGGECSYFASRSYCPAKLERADDSDKHPEETTRRPAKSESRQVWQ